MILSLCFSEKIVPRSCSIWPGAVGDRAGWLGYGVIAIGYGVQNPSTVREGQGYNFPQL